MLFVVYQTIYVGIEIGEIQQQSTLAIRKQPCHNRQLAVEVNQRMEMLLSLFFISFLFLLFLACANAFTSHLFVFSLCLLFHVVSHSRLRPTVNPSVKSKLLESAQQHSIDIYRHAPSRPDTLYPQPIPDKTAAKCRRDVCLLPDCFCGGKDIPGTREQHT